MVPPSQTKKPNSIGDLVRFKLTSHEVPQCYKTLETQPQGSMYQNSIHFGPNVPK